MLGVIRVTGGKEEAWACNHQFYSVINCGLVLTKPLANMGIADSFLLQKRPGLTDFHLHWYIFYMETKA